MAPGGSLLSWARGQGSPKSRPSPAHGSPEREPLRQGHCPEVRTVQVPPASVRRAAVQQGSPQRKSLQASQGNNKGSPKAMGSSPQGTRSPAQPQVRRPGAAAGAEGRCAGSCACIAWVWLLGAALIAVAALACLVAVKITLATEGPCHDKRLQASSQQAFLQGAYQVAEDFYRSKAQNGRRSDSEQLLWRVNALQKLRLRAVEENATLNATTPWGEPILVVLDKVVKDSAFLGRRATAPPGLLLPANASEGLPGVAVARDPMLGAPAAGEAKGYLAAGRVLELTDPKDRERLFCFSVIMPTGREPELIAMQVSRRVSIFACDAYAVYADRRMRVGPGPPPYEIETTPIYMRVDSKVKLPYPNAETFMRVWESIFQEQTYWDYEWTVKADPDSVLFPAVLRAHLQMTWGSLAKSEKDTGRGLYLRNCAPSSGASFGLLGSLEVLSQRAVEVYAQGKLACVAHVKYRGEPEDRFLQSCLDLLNVSHRYDFGLLNDQRCAGRPRPCSSGHAAFHPVAGTIEFGECLLEAGAGQDSQAGPGQADSTILT